MRIDVHYTPLGFVAGDLAGRGVVVIDVLRATSTIVAALASGAKAVVPTATSEEAVKITAKLEKDGFALAGERRFLKIPGFALGNSPREMTPEAVGGRTVYLATTNGTPALIAAQGGGPVLVGSAVNFAALTERARAECRDRGGLVIICAGHEKQFALEDAYVAGRLVKAVKRGQKRIELNDAASVAVDLAGRYPAWLEALKACQSARQLEELDLGADVTFCAKANRFDLVPVYADRRITV